MKKLVNFINGNKVSFLFFQTANYFADQQRGMEYLLFGMSRAAGQTLDQFVVEDLQVFIQTQFPFCKNIFLSSIPRSSCSPPTPPAPRA